MSIHHNTAINLNGCESPTQVLFINMPFGEFVIPALGISLLKAELEERNIPCDVHYFSISFAEVIGPTLYTEIVVSTRRNVIGERVFVPALFDLEEFSQPDHFDDIREGLNDCELTPEHVDALISARDTVIQFIDDCLEAITWEQYQIIGFSSNYQQNVASLALAKRIKQIWPEKIIVFGGANCEGEMGLELHRQFPFVDYVWRGDGDEGVPQLVESLLAGEQLPHLPGLVLRREGESVALGDGASPVIDLDSLPYPNYSDYFKQLETSTLELSKPIALPFEASRGCWYATKRHCTFCGMLGESVVYRCKHPDRVRQEIIHLTSRYGIQRLYASDNILDLGYFKDLIPSLVESDPEWSIYYEVKSNLTKEQLRLLKEAGIDHLQPGIESLSTELLKLMRKGCTLMQNIQLLKWASQLGLDLFWNIITNLPGEDPGEYERMIAIIPALFHLQPPVGFGSMRLERFSPYFNDPEAFGFANVRAAHGYKFAYPFSYENLDRLAYIFDYDYPNGEPAIAMLSQLEAAVVSWQKNYCPGALTCVSDDHSLYIYDRRPHTEQQQYALKGVEKAAYLYCDEAHSLKTIHGHLRESGYDVDESSLRRMFQGWGADRLMLCDGDWFLSLAVQADEFVDQIGDSDVIKQAFTGALAEMADIRRKERLNANT